MFGETAAEGFLFVLRLRNRRLPHKLNELVPLPRIHIYERRIESPKQTFWLD
jgi:hypothetical protein